MKLTGKVIKQFDDKTTNKTYYPADEYRNADIFTAERFRYEELYKLGYVEKGKKVEINTKKED